ncbi:toll/interleukin-1 receptor domain-containing protein [Streptomyces sp. URMC 129]|uniref:toll/interleukin-1 receptor domain-containing protein n=1 Tax=Streptomyces sp. URMC 129 TaxID=3423407 RepID=UPI003F52AAA3
MFISHSSRLRTPSELRPGDTLNRHRHRKKFVATLLRLLETGLTAAGFEVWIDRGRLPPGEPFDPKIHVALQRCDIAVFLIDLDALDAAYVRKEATILMWRLQMGDTHVVLPVLLGGVTERDLAASGLGAPVGLDTLVTLRPATTKLNRTAAETVAREVTEALTHRLPEAPPPAAATPAARWIHDFAEYISGISEERLWRVAERLGFGPDDWARAREDPHLAVASAMLGADLAPASQAIVQLADLIDEEGARTRVVRRALPLWVDLDAAKIVADVTKLPAHRRVLALTTPALRLAEHVVQRATCAAPEYATQRLPDAVGEAAHAELLERYDTTLRRLLHLSARDSPDEIAAELDSLGGGVFVLLRCENLRPGTAASVLGALRGRFPGVVFVALARKESLVWQQLDAPQAYRGLDDGQERSARRYVSRTAKLIGEDIAVDSDD